MSQAQDKTDELLTYLPELSDEVGKALRLPLSLHDSISQLRQRASGRILEISMDAISCEADGEFDFVISVGALAVCRDFDGFVGKIKQLLAPQGQLLLCEPELAAASRRGDQAEARSGINPDITLRLWRNDMSLLWVNRHTAPNTASPTAGLWKLIGFWRSTPRTHWHRYFCGAASVGPS